MNLKMEYLPVSDGAALLSCRGCGSWVSLPDAVDGLPLREIGPYAFSAPGAAAERVPPGTEIRSAVSGDPAAPDGRARFLGGPSLRRITLPAGIRSVGEYAFYNCTGLSRVEFGAGPARIGNGAFMNCGALTGAAFRMRPDEPTCLPGLLAEVPRELRVTFRAGAEESVWIFPEYYEESVENAPAHIFEHFIHGAGYRYRQCFEGDRLDPLSYDGQFRMAQVEAEPPTVLRIAWERLRRPFRLSGAFARQYLAYLKENAVAAARLPVLDDDPEGLTLLADRGVLTEESAEAAMKLAAQKGRTECLGALLDARRRGSSPKEKTYDL
jgi:hypothetical protein